MTKLNIFFCCKNHIIFPKMSIFHMILLPHCSNNQITYKILRYLTWRHIFFNLGKATGTSISTAIGVPTPSLSFLRDERRCLSNLQSVPSPCLPDFLLHPHAAHIHRAARQTPKCCTLIPSLWVCRRAPLQIIGLIPK